MNRSWHSERFRRGRLRSFPVAFIAGLPLFSSPAGAQSADPPAATGTSEGTDVLQEVTVTARKRAESLQDVPIAVTAFDERALEARGIQSIDQVGAYTPNMQFDTVAAFSGSSATTVVFLRGIGQTDFNQNTEPGVGVYLDGVYIARSPGSILDVVDVERIEILRGPQGTLFGRNTIGGAVNVITKKPAATPGGFLEALYGADNRVNLKGSFDVPFSARVRGKLSALYQRQDGYISQPLVPGSDDLGEVNRLGLLGALSVYLADNLTADFTIDYSRQRQPGAPIQLLVANSQSAFGSYFNALQSANPAVCVTGDSSAALADPSCYNSRWIVPGQSFGTGLNIDDNDVWGAAATVTWSPLSALTLKSITSYRDLDAQFANDGDGSPFRINETRDLYTQHQLSEELQLSGAAFDHRLDWIVGGYYFREGGRDENFVDFSIGTLKSGGSIDNRARALFGQATFAVTHKLDLTAGVRYTREDKDFLPDQFFILGPEFPPGLRIIPFETFTNRVRETTWLGTLAYHWTHDLMTYVQQSRGFKSGGFTQRNSAPLDAPPQFAPELADSTELGLKFQGLDNRLRINAAAFYTDYQDLQITVFEGLGDAPTTRNAAAARISGAELELTVAPTANWLIESGVGYLDAAYKRVSLPPSANFASVTTSSKLAYAPKWTATLGTSLTVPLQSGSITGRLDWSHKSEEFKDAVNTPELFQKAYDIFGASLSWKDGSEKWRVTLRGDNLGDEKYILGGSSETIFSGNAGVAFARGREWSLRLRRDF